MTQGSVPSTGAPGASAGGGVPERPSAYPSATTPVEGSGGTREEAKQGAQHVAQEATESGRRVADTAKGEAGRTVEAAKETAAETAQEAKAQLQSLVSQTMTEFSEQAGSQQNRLASGLSSVSSELESMAGSSTEQGLATEIVRRAADYARRSGEYLEDREPGDVLEDVKTYARRHPGAFIAIAAGLGVVAGRLTRGAKDASSSDAGSVPRTSVTTAGADTPSYTPLTGSTTASARTGATTPPPPAPPSGTTPGAAGAATAPLSSPGGRPSDRPGGVLP